MPNPLAGRVWEELSLYESRDLIDRFFKSRHDRDLSAEKANEITSNLAQGREYFSSAREAGELVRPLLLYYGVLALSRGLILALEPGTREASLSSSHGLVTLQWAQTLSAGIKELGKLQMQFATGTVSDLARATKNRDWGIYHGPTIPTWQVFEEAGSEHVPNGRSFLLQDVLARIPNLRDLYERTFEEHAHCYSGNVHQFITPPLQRNLYVDGTALGLPAEERVRNDLKIPATIPMAARTDHAFRDGRLHYFIRDQPEPGNDFIMHIPQMTLDGRGQGFFVAPLFDDVRLSTLSLL